MKIIIISTLILLLASCHHNLKNSLIFYNKDSISEAKLVLTQYDKSKNAYYGKATINNLSTDKRLRISGFELFIKDKIYNIYIDSIATVTLDIYPLKSAEINVITTDIPKDINLNELKIKLGFPMQDVISVGNHNFIEIEVIKVH